MMLHYLFGRWSVGFNWRYWLWGLSTWDDGSWLYAFGPVGLFYDAHDTQEQGDAQKD